MENILQESNIVYRNNSVQRNTIYGKDYGKIRHHLWGEKNLNKTNITYGKDTVKIRQHIYANNSEKIKHHLQKKKFCTKQTPFVEKILRNWNTNYGNGSWIQRHSGKTDITNEAVTTLQQYNGVYVNTKRFSNLTASLWTTLSRDDTALTRGLNIYLLLRIYRRYILKAVHCYSEFIVLAMLHCLLLLKGNSYWLN